MDTQEQVPKAHSPLPWRWLPEEGQFIVDAKGNTVGEIPCQGCNPVDGAFIVKAVNERAELIAALKEFLSSGIEFDDSRMGYVVMQVDRGTIREARALLDKVNKQ